MQVDILHKQNLVTRSLSIGPRVFPKSGQPVEILIPFLAKNKFWCVIHYCCEHRFSNLLQLRFLSSFGSTIQGILLR